jgi:maltooligosyltrehalose trehalohydrolase
VTPPAQRLAASLLLFAPYLPLLLLGEEYGEDHPFRFFCSFSDPKLIESVRTGRRREFEAFNVDADSMPDPQAESTFIACRLSWSWETDRHRSGLRRLYQDLLRARREWPALRKYSQRTARLLPDVESAAVLKLTRGRPELGGALEAFCNLTAHAQSIPIEDRRDQLWSSEAECYHGIRRAATDERSLLPYECLVFRSA